MQTKQRYIAHGIILATINIIRKYAHYSTKFKPQHLICVTGFANLYTPPIFPL